MRKLLTVLAGVLLTTPLAALDLAAESAIEPSVRISTGTQLTNVCWVLIGGKWYSYSC